MRNEFNTAMIEIASSEDFIFLTGDLGYNALESLRQTSPERFINAGVAEQNMISVAAGLAKSGFKPWVYSIAPFSFARPFEQIRNDICLHKLPVTVVGNGGGYGYGVMGATHHAIEDYGTLLGLQHMKAYIPSFKDDLKPQVNIILQDSNPAYFRLGRCEKPSNFISPPYKAIRKLLSGTQGILIVVGPLIGSYLPSLTTLSESQRPSVWIVNELPIASIAKDILQNLLQEIRISKKLIVAEEHVLHGSFGQSLAYHLLENHIPIEHFSHLYAKGYLSGLYGSQQFHRNESHIDIEHLMHQMKGIYETPI